MIYIYVCYLFMKYYSHFIFLSAKFKEEYEVRYNFLKKYFGETVIAVNEVFALFLEKPFAWDSKTEKCPSQNFFEVIVTFASLYIKSNEENENTVKKVKIHCSVYIILLIFFLYVLTDQQKHRH